ncbi:hypothetical protein GGF37_002229, partial [Kickxella alabastrina]
RALDIKEAMFKGTKFCHIDQFRYKEFTGLTTIETSTQRQIAERIGFIYNCWKKQNGQQIL